jgi:hypothetical protein
MRGIDRRQGYDLLAGVYVKWSALYWREKRRREKNSRDERWEVV